MINNNWPTLAGTIRLRVLCLVSVHEHALTRAGDNLAPNYTVAVMGNRKSHKTAVVVIPPEDIWAPIQAIRRQHDRQLRRWMPHVTLVYPFRPSALLDQIMPAVAQVGADVQPFQIKLEKFNCFRHGRQHYTLWLAPHLTDRLTRLHERI